MRIFVDKLSDVSVASVQRVLVRLQDSINHALGLLPFDYAERINQTGYSSEFANKVIKHHMPKPPWGFHLVYLRNLTADSSPPASGCFVDWIPDAGGVRIRSISGLTSGQLYEMRFIVYA